LQTKTKAQKIQRNLYSCHSHTNRCRRDVNGEQVMTKTRQVPTASRLWSG